MEKKIKDTQHFEDPVSGKSMGAVFPGEDVVKVVAMTTKDLDYCIRSAERAAAGTERTDPSSGRSSLVGKTLSGGTACCREVVRKRKSRWTCRTSLLAE